MEVPCWLDEARLEELYSRIERRLYNVVYRFTWDAGEAQDVAQEAFVRLWRMRERVDPATVAPLVFTIALNLARNRRRSRRLWQMVSLGAVAGRAALGPSPDLSLEERERGAAVRHAVEALPAKLREAVVLCELSGLAHAEVARMLHVPEGTVGSRRHRGLALLRARLAEGKP